MFREQLHKDLDGISPSDELLSRVSQMMAEEAAKPKQPIYLNVAKWGGMAAAVCLIAVGAFAFAGRNSETTPGIATADVAGMAREAAYSPDNAMEDMALQTPATVQITAYSKEMRIILPPEASDAVYEIMCGYYTENPHSLIDINLTPEQMDMYTASGLYIRIDTPYSEEWLVLIDDNSSFAVKNGEIFPLYDEYKDKITEYFK